MRQDLTDLWIWNVGSQFQNSTSFKEKFSLWYFFYERLNSSSPPSFHYFFSLKHFLSPLLSMFPLSSLLFLLFSTLCSRLTSPFALPLTSLSSLSNLTPPFSLLPFFLQSHSFFSLASLFPQSHSNLSSCLPSPHSLTPPFPLAPFSPSLTQTFPLASLFSLVSLRTFFLPPFSPTLPVSVMLIMRR